jgi:hypothetical protein
MICSGSSENVSINDESFWTRYAVNGLNIVCIFPSHDAAIRLPMTINDDQTISFSPICSLSNMYEKRSVIGIERLSNANRMVIFWVIMKAMKYVYSASQHRPRIRVAVGGMPPLPPPPSRTGLGVRESSESLQIRPQSVPFPAAEEDRLGASPGAIASGGRRRERCRLRLIGG